MALEVKRPAAISNTTEVKRLNIRCLSSAHHQSAKFTKDKNEYIFFFVLTVYVFKKVILLLVCVHSPQHSHLQAETSQWSRSHRQEC